MKPYNRHNLKDFFELRHSICDNHSVIFTAVYPCRWEAGRSFHLMVALDMAKVLDCTVEEMCREESA